MTTKNANKTRGEKNSSHTRVNWFFRNLFRHDLSGLSWLPKLLLTTPLNCDYASHTSMLDCLIKDHCLEMKKCSVNKTQTRREHCFEFSLPPSNAFMRWLIMHPERLRAPKDMGTKDKEKRLKRECLLGQHGMQKRKEITQEAVDKLNEYGYRFKISMVGIRGLYSGGLSY